MMQVNVVPSLAGGGGAEGIRTPDLYNASVALSQLSYSPLSSTNDALCSHRLAGVLYDIIRRSVKEGDRPSHEIPCHSMLGMLVFVHLGNVCRIAETLQPHASQGRQGRRPLHFLQFFVRNLHLE